jgi:uncharacterized protein (TIGR00304 family)
MILLFFLGIILIFLGLAIMFSPMGSPKIIQEMNKAQDNKDESKISEDKHEVRGGAIIMIGPIPIVMGSDSKTALLLMMLALTIMVFWFLITK